MRSFVCYFCEIGFWVWFLATTAQLLVSVALLYERFVDGGPLPVQVVLSPCAFLLDLLLDLAQIILDLRIPSSFALSHLFLLSQHALSLRSFFPFQSLPFFLPSLLLALFVCLPFLQQSFLSLLFCLLLQENPLLGLIEQGDGLDILLFTLIYSLFISTFIFLFYLIQQVIAILFQSFLLISGNSFIPFIFFVVGRECLFSLFLLFFILQFNLMVDFLSPFLLQQCLSSSFLCQLLLVFFIIVLYYFLLSLFLIFLLFFLFLKAHHCIFVIHQYFPPLFFHLFDLFLGHPALMVQSRLLQFYQTAVFPLSSACLEILFLLRHRSIDAVQADILTVY